MRLGFDGAKHELLMILDADLTVRPRICRSSISRVVEGHADLANGSRLVYDLEPGAMQFLNILGNKFFSAVFSVLLQQPVKDTLCGTKVLRKRRLRGDRTLALVLRRLRPVRRLRPAARRGAASTLRIVDVPVRYQARTYGTTNISRFRHGLILVRMAAFGFWKLRVVPYTAAALRASLQHDEAAESQERREGFSPRSSRRNGVYSHAGAAVVSRSRR